MLKLIEVKAAANDLLKAATGYKIYGKEVIEGYETPSLFTEIVTKPFLRETRNYARSGFTLKITYFQKTPDEIEQLKLIDTVKNAFGMIFKVGDRKLTVGEIEHDYVGQKEDILQISVNFDCYEDTRTQDTEDIAQSVEVEFKEE